MTLFNHAAKELTAKIVYYGPGLAGKTSNLRFLQQRLEPSAGKLLSLSTAQDRTIYFDVLPVELGNIRGYAVRFHVCTVPGQVFYNETRKLVLRDADGLVFVVDSQWSMLSQNLESFQNLKDNLHDEKISFGTLPIVVQYNKRDLPTALSVEALQDSLGFHSYPHFEAAASEGTGVVETFRLATKLTFVDLMRRHQRGWQTPDESPDESPAEAPAEPPAAAPEEAASVPAETPVLAIAGSPGQPEDAPEPVTFEPSLLLAALETPLLAAPSLREPPHEHPAVDPAPVFQAATPALAIPAAARTSSVDEKLNAVLAEARKSARRVSGPNRRFEPLEGTAPEAGAHDQAEHRLEEAIAGLRTEVQSEIVRLREELSAVREAAAGAQTAAALAAERVRRLEDVLRQALQGLAG